MVRPNINTIKINCEAAWSSDTGRGRSGVVARNFKGQLVSVTHGAEVTEGIEYLEAKAVFLGVKLAVDNK